MHQKVNSPLYGLTQVSSKAVTSGNTPVLASLVSPYMVHIRSERGLSDNTVQAYRRDISHFVEFDFLVINDDFDTALGDLLAVVRACRHRQPLQAVRHMDRLQSLLSS